MLITPGYELPQRESLKITYTLIEEIKQQTESRKARKAGAPTCSSTSCYRRQERVLLTSRVGKKGYSQHGEKTGTEFHMRSPQRERGGRPFQAERTMDFF